jgi:hypothetical protein
MTPPQAIRSHAQFTERCELVGDSFVAVVEVERGLALPESVTGEWPHELYPRDYEDIDSIYRDVVSAATELEVDLVQRLHLIWEQLQTKRMLGVHIHLATV